MPTTQSKPLDQFELNKCMRAKAEALSKLFRECKIPLECVYTSWEDAMRAYGSAGGPNIADVGLLFRTPSGEEVSAEKALETYGFKCRSNNFHEVLVEVDARTFSIIVSDPDGSNPRSMVLSEVLKNAGKLFKHCGLPEDCNLYDASVDDGKVKLRMDLIFAPKGAVEEGKEFSTKEFALTKYSFQAQTGNARNVDLFSHPQGTACSDDVSGKKFLRPQCFDAETGTNNDFWFEAENTGKKVQDMHTETAEESAAAAARGKGTAVRTGCEGWDKLPSLFYFIQVPRKQDPVSYARPSLSSYSSLGAAAAWTSAGPMEEDEGGEEAPTYRSMGAPSSTPCVYRGLGGASPARKGAVASKLESARLSRGSYAAEAAGVQSKTVVRAAGEPITITCSMVVIVDGDEPPAVPDVQHLWDTVKRMMKIAGEAKDLHDPEAGLTTGAPLTTKDLAQIVEKQAEFPAPPQKPPMPTAPKVGIPVEVV